MNQHVTFFLSAAATALPALLCTGCGPRAQEQAVQELGALVQRVTPAFAGKVIFRIDPLCGAEPLLSTQGGKLLITAADRAECARAYGYYLRELAHVHLSWNGDNAAAAPFVLPQQPVTVPATRPYNYALNYCTISYSGIHWDEERWMREIDLFALCGYKYVLVTAGLEQVWQQFLQELGCTPEQIAAFIPNPAYSAWWNMGNLEGEGGPVHPDIIRREGELGRRMVSRLHALGLEPVLQGYVGFLPHDINPELVDGHIINQGKWVGPYERPAVLAPTSAGYAKLAARWYELLEQQYGYRAKAFAGDLFHEGGNTKGINITACAHAVQRAMQQAAPGSRWFLQAWAHNPHPALLRGLDKRHTILLVLDKDMTPDHDPYYLTNDYLKRPQIRNSGFPYVWCELSNFGGNHGLYGGTELLEKLTPDAEGDMGDIARHADGLGLISEGVETNPLFYTLFTERLNNKAGVIERQDFLRRYIRNRYGAEDAELQRALTLLAETVYAPDTMREGCWENLMCARPSLDADRASTWSSPKCYYDTAKVEEAARLMLAAGKRLKLDDRETFRYDMADLTRQVLSDRARAQLDHLAELYDDGQIGPFLYESEVFLNLIDSTARVLGTSEHFLLGPYVAGAENRAGDNAEARRQMRESMLRLFTTWSKGNTSLNDYAHRQLAELMRSYYYPRWRAYLLTKAQELMDVARAPEADSGGGAVSNNGAQVSFSYEKNAAVDAIQDSFPYSDVPLMQQPEGNVLEEAEKVLNKKKPEGGS